MSSRIEPRLTLLLLLLVAACGSGGIASAPDDTVTAGDVPVGDPGPDDSPGLNDALDAEDAAEAGDTPILPEVYARPEKGDPVTAEDLAVLTDLYLAMLAGTRYFDLIDDRVHGWPESDPLGRYWYATWWSGVQVIKKEGRVTYLHGADGADNNALRTAPLLANACFAYRLWRNPADLHLVHRLVRGINSWILAMQSDSRPDAGVLMTRAFYPESVASTDGGRNLFIDHSLNRPGEDNMWTNYVHVPDNALWGDIYVKSKRSKDDIGQLLLAIGLLRGCEALAGSPALEADFVEMHELHAEWCRRVEDDDWRIATWDTDRQVWFPEQDLAYFIQHENLECKGMLAVRLCGRGDAGPLDCGDGNSVIDEVPGLNNDFHQIQRSFHQAAAALAERAGHGDVALAMRQGLAWRIETVLDLHAQDPRPEGLSNDADLGQLLLMSLNAGVPLTWREVRFVHDRIREAHDGYLATPTATYDVFSPATPDGSYPYEPGGPGLNLYYLGSALGDCASPYRNPTSKPLLDCERVRAWTRGHTR